jgi:hypothetical protein
MVTTPMPFVGAMRVVFDVTTYFKPTRYTVSGVTRDSAGAALGDCSVEIYETVSGLLRGATVSDANGNYTFDVTGGEAVDIYGNLLTFFVVAYKAGAPDVFGTTVNTLVGSPN